MTLDFYFTLRIMENLEKLGFKNDIKDLDMFFKDIDIIYNNYLETTTKEQDNYYNSIIKYIENNKNFIIDNLKNSLELKKD